MTRLALALVSVALAMPSGLSAQARFLGVAPGQRVRVTAPEYGFRRTAATLLDIRTDTLYVLRLQTRTVAGQPASRDSVISAMPLAAIERLDVSRGRRSRWAQGLGMGAALGAATGALIGFASGDDESGFIQFSAGEKAAMGSVAFGVLGGVIGAVIGASSHGEQWQEVPRDRFHVTVAPTGTGVFLGARLAF